MEIEVAECSEYVEKLLCDQDGLDETDVSERSQDLPRRKREKKALGKVQNLMIPRIKKPIKRRSFDEKEKLKNRKVLSEAFELYGRDWMKITEYVSAH